MESDRTKTEALARGGEPLPRRRIHADWFLLLACLLAAYGGGGLVVALLWW